VADTSEGRAVTQRDLTRLERWADRNLSGNGRTLQHRRFHLSSRETFFTVRLTEHWHRLPREVVQYRLGKAREPGRLLSIWSPLDMVLGSQL